MPSKILSAITFALIICTNTFAQTCCSNSTHTFAMLGSDSKFKNSHAEPEPFIYKPNKGKVVSFGTPDGKKSKAFYVAAAAKTNKYVFVFHEWWGLNDYIIQTAEQLQTELGYVNVLALDLYDGEVAAKADVAAHLMQNTKAERCMAIIMGASAFAGDDAQIQTIGWCFGGGWSMQAAEILKSKTKGCIIYYGMPEKDAAQIEKINFPMLGIFAKNDGWITPKIVSDFETAMKSAGKKVEIKMYDAEHAFANPSNPKHNKEFADDAMKMVVGFILENFK